LFSVASSSSRMKLLLWAAAMMAPIIALMAGW
jgi:hypothetical protein